MCFNIKLYVCDSLNTRHEREHHLVFAYHMTATFCARASDVCAQETEVSIILIKMHDFGTIDIIMKSKHIFLRRVSEVYYEL